MSDTPIRQATEAGTHHRAGAPAAPALAPQKVLTMAGIGFQLRKLARQETISDSSAARSR